MSQPPSPASTNLVILRKARELQDCALRAQDGVLGRIKDLYFDDRGWRLRYFEVEAGDWLTGRRVLVSPESVRHPDWKLRELPVKLTQDQVRNSPTSDTQRPVSRQHEVEMSRYYGWTPYWDLMYAGAMVELPPMVAARNSTGGKGDAHLRSRNEVVGSHVAASDGEIGHVDELLIDDHAWTIRYLVVDTRNWWPGKKVLVSPWWITDIEWATARVKTNLSRAAIQGGPPYNSAQALTVDQAGRLHDYYGRPRYEDWEPDN